MCCVRPRHSGLRTGTIAGHWARLACFGLAGMGGVGWHLGKLADADEASVRFKISVRIFR